MKKLKQSILKIYLKEQYFPQEESTLIKKKNKIFKISSTVLLIYDSIRTYSLKILSKFAKSSMVTAIQIYVNANFLLLFRNNKT